MRQELEKYEHFRPPSKPINNIFEVIESELNDYGYEIQPLKIRDVEDRKKKLEITDMGIPEKI